MSLSVIGTLRDGVLSAAAAGGPPGEQTRYFYTLYGDGQALDTRGPEGSEVSFDLEQLGFAGGACQVEAAVEYGPVGADGSERETARSAVVFYYRRRRLSYEQLEREILPAAGLTLYEVEWDGVVFELMFHPVPDSSQLVVFGNGNVPKDAELPVFQRLSWYSRLPCSGLWYFDPSLYLGQARICWGYGTGRRWYLRDISQIVAQISDKLGARGNDLLFYGSSGGGFTSMMLACMLRGKACVLNPQCLPGHFYPYLVEPMKAVCLEPGQSMEEERMNAAAFFRREGFVPYVRCVQNWGAEDDVYGQLTPFLDELEGAFPQKDRPVELSWFYSDRGHNSWPSEMECVRTIREALAHQDARLEGGDGPDRAAMDVSYGVAQGAVTAEIRYPAADSSTRYACYLLNEKGEAVQKQMYQKDRVFTFSAEPGVYGLRAFVSTGGGPGQEPTRFTRLTQLVTVCPTVALDYSEMEKTDFCREQLTIYTVQWNGASFAFAVRCPPTARRAVVLGPGDVGWQSDRPAFHRLSWAEQVPGCAIYYFDPTVYGGRSGLCWGYGTNRRWYLEHIAVLLKKIMDRLSIPLADTLFFGSSGGGYMSILLAAMLHGRAMAINPQLELERDYPARQKRFRAAVLEPGEDLLPERTHVLRLIEREGFFPPVRLMQNQTAQVMVTDLLVPFLEQLSQWNRAGVENLHIHFYSQGGGSGALPPKKDCLRLMAEELARPAPCLEKFGPYPPNALMARLEAGAFDSGAEKERTPDFSGPPIPQPIPAVAGGQIMTCAQELMAGKLWLYHRIEPMDYTLETLDFNTRFSRVPNSFQLYLQGLNPIQILTAAYQASGERAFLTYAGRFLEAWRQYAAGPDAARNPFVFQNAHAVSLRVENLMYFGQSCAQAGISVSGLYGLLLKHGAWLRDGGNYNGRHNYGIMQSLALLRLGYVLRRPEWVTRAKKRLFAQKKSSFDREYVHRENSPAYSDMVIDLFQRAGRCLDAHQDPAGQVLLDEMRRAYEFMRWAVKPDGTMAQIGDTPTAPPRVSMDSALPPPEGRRLFLQSGYCFWRSAGGQSQDTWKMLKAGFDNKTHKHADDLSFMLYARGQDVFVDCGMYGYTNDGFRTYLCSANAHNTVVVDGGSYPLTPASMALVGVEQHRFLPACDWVTVFNRAYTGVCIRRRFLSSQDVTILIDWAESRAEHTYSQLFHLGELVEMVYASDNEVILRLEQSGCRVRLRQLGPPSQLSLIQGTTDRPGYGLLSRGENHLEACRSLKFDLTGTEGRWITIITIEAEDGSVLLQDGSRVPACEISYDQRKNAILLGHTIIPL